ncbi:MAG: FAD-binding oxidoreductase [Acidovorax sp.]
MDSNPIAQISSQLPQALPALDWITDSLKVARLSQDFSWFSPVLKQALQGKRGDIAVRPRTEAEIAAVVAHCAQAGVPVTVRGSGTGNYGQSTPLHGGVILDLSNYDRLCWVRGSAGRAQAGIRLADFDQLARAQGQELRWLPSTYRSATLGGLFGGGFGGAGSITYGPLAAPGNVLAARVMTVEPQPRILELRGAEAMRLHHTYGTTGIVLELEVALTEATDWTECIATFAGFDAALAFAQQVGNAPGMRKKELSLMAAPIPAYFTSLDDHLPAGCHAVILLIAPEAEEAMQLLLDRHGGTLGYCARGQWSAQPPAGGYKSLIEYCWNHTTLHALKVDKGLTYLQTGYTPGRFAEQLQALRGELGDEVLFHLEFLRTKEGAFNCSGLELVRFTSPERLDAIMDIYRKHGVQINNPHVYVVEDGKANNQLDPALLQTKAELDPFHLLNPGKLRSAALPACVQAPATAV